MILTKHNATKKNRILMLLSRIFAITEVFLSFLFDFNSMLILVQWKNVISGFKIYFGGLKGEGTKRKNKIISDSRRLSLHLKNENDCY